MPTDVAGIQRLGVFEQIKLPDGTTLTPSTGTAQRVTLTSSDPKRPDQTAPTACRTTPALYFVPLPSDPC